MASTAADGMGRRRLIFLGDMIHRGPDNIGVLKLWAKGEKARGVRRIDRIMGNDDQILLLQATAG